MKEILIFSGTTEGRALSEGLASRGIPHTVFVATEYGEQMMHDDPLVTVRQGRLDEAEMEDLFRGTAESSDSGVTVYDATHPFAVEVTANIRTACEKAGCEYVRVLRDEDGSAGTVTSARGSDVRFFADAAECAEALASEEGSILLTTGSKELKSFTSVPGIAERAYARVLPSAESIGLCLNAGLNVRHIIAMHGPFSEELNRALIDQYDIKILVTKETGSAGGYPEKLKACADRGIKAFVIGRPAEIDGITVEEALAAYGSAPAAFDYEPAAPGGAETEAPEGAFSWASLDLDDDPDLIRVSLIGIGPGSPELLTKEASDRIEEADVLFGAPRMLESFSGKPSFPYYLAKDVLPVITGADGDSRYCVLFSGDSGFFSGAKKMKTGLEEGLAAAGLDYEIEILPGVSSLSLFAARLGTDYSDAALCSMHGSRDKERAAAALIGELRKRGKVFTLLSGKDDAVLLAEKLRDCGPKNASLFIGKDLSYPGEAVSMVDIASGRLIPDAAGCSDLASLPEGSYVACISAPLETGRPIFPLLGDDAFDRGKVPMTKESIRHLSVARLELSEGSVLYDIGSGTGSIAVQAASISDTIRVYAIEKKPEALELIRANAAKHRLPNVIPVKGTAPEALIDLEKPTHAFIGGSGGNLREILEVLRGKNPGMRVVLNAVSLETIAEMTAVVKEFPVSGLTIEQVQVSRSRALGNYHLMTADNPVMICTFNFAPVQSDAPESTEN